MNGVLPFLEEGEPFDGKGRQRGTFHAFEQLAHLLLDRAVDPRVGDGRLPMQQEVVLLFQTLELAGFQRIAFDVLHARFDLALVARHVRPGGQDHHAVVFAERPQLGMQFRLVPVRLGDRRPQIVDHQRLDAAAKMVEGVLQAADEVSRCSGGTPLRCILCDCGSARCERRGVLRRRAVAADDRGPAAEIHLGLFPGSHSIRRKGSSRVRPSRRTNRITLQ